ncbi:MAG: type II secretion system F family protein [Phycisphaerales bacterium]
MTTSATSQSTYFYQAMNDAGAKKMGLRAAPDEAALAQSLVGDQLYLISAWRVPFTSSSSGASAGAPDRAARVPLKDEVAVNEQLHTLLDRGVPLVEVLEVGASVVSNRTKPKVLRLRELVSAGSSFADACEQVGGFDPVAAAVYRAAERTGDLGSAAGRLAEAARRRLQMIGKTITVMIYPAVILTVAILILFGLLAFLVPSIADQIEAMGSTPPWYSQVVFSLGRWLNENLLAVLIIVAGALAISIVLKGIVLGAIASVARRIGAIARLLRAIELTRLFAVLGAMTRSGVPLAEALAFSTRVISDPVLRGQLEKLQQSLVEGGVLRRLLEDVTALPLPTRRLLIAAERGGDLDSAFDGLSADMAEDVERRSSRLLALLEPLIIVGMFTVLGPLVIAIAIPLMTVSPQ